MKEKNRIFIFFVVLIAISIVCTGCAKQAHSRVQESNLVTIPLEIEEHHSFSGLYGNSILYQTMGKGAYTFYRYDLDTNETKKIGTVNDFILSSEKVVLIDNMLYSYITIENEYGHENALYAIDMSSNTLSYLYSDHSTNVLIPLDTLKGEVVSLIHNKYPDSNTGDTALISYNPDTKMEKNLLYKTLDYNSKTGSAMINFDVFEEKIYVLTEVAVDGKASNQIEVYDEKFNLIDTIDLEHIDEIAEKLGQPILTFKVMGRYIFIRNISNEVVLASQTDKGLEVILQGEYMDIVKNFENENLSHNCIIIEGESKNYYILNQEKGLQKYTLPLEPDSYILAAYANAEGIFFVSDNYADDTQSLYYLDNAYLLSEN